MSAQKATICQTGGISTKPASTTNTKNLSDNGLTRDPDIPHAGEPSRKKAKRDADRALLHLMEESLQECQVRAEMDRMLKEGRKRYEKIRKEEETNRQLREMLYQSQRELHRQQERANRENLLFRAYTAEFQNNTYDEDIEADERFMRGMMPDLVETDEEDFEVEEESEYSDYFEEETESDYESDGEDESDRDDD
ncbi:hypothetical protein N7466_007661 [Penicillium verhagenii]|uniref:uncharacterized protein n=1 Tax=Penicillium verhagenii TaxID=1562060 RepID=UPI002544D85D|nr:uncharacterized protein N7466_007661 [Penicillium verhagenii]KAJ5928705.1 hypothetical protein N7466_007661 [Penicillium verhagenii]